MAVMLGYEALKGVIGMPEAIDLLEATLRNEAAGKTFISPKFSTDFGSGSMRVLVAADHQAGYLATKAYHIVEGVGVRYVVSLYRLKDGELLAILDGQLITDLRTGAASGVVARKVRISDPVTIGLIGSGNQARTQLESLASVYRVRSAGVYSPTPENREHYAREMSERLGFPITPVDSAEAAARSHPVVVAASSARSTEPVLRGKWLDGCRLLCAVGNTRAQFAEADVRCFSDAELLVTDSPHAFEEAGELVAVARTGSVPPSRRATLSEVVSGGAAIPQEGRVAFKSVGTALQDLSLAVRYFELLGARAGLAGAPDLGSLRRPVRAR
jgi:ornithine cyclodeaminase/alanine dehydrogenase-like protein (mu-crystallin family)